MLHHLFHAPRAYYEKLRPYYDQLNFYGTRDDWLASTEGVPQKIVRLYAVHWLHLEVHNGGFWQYFYNSTSNSAPEARDGFAVMGMHDVSDVVAAAMTKVGKPFPFDKSLREDIVGPPDDRMDFKEEEELFLLLADTPKIFRRKPRFVEFADRFLPRALRQVGRCLLHHRRIVVCLVDAESR